MTPALAKPVVFSFVLLLVLFAVNAGISYHYTRELHKNARVADSFEVLDALSDTLAIVSDAETGQHNYILTGDPAYLESYQTAFLSRGEVIARLKRLTADNPEQQNRLAQLEQKIAARMQIAERSIALRRDQGFDAARDYLASGAGKRETEEFRAVAAEIERGESEQLHARVAEVGRSFSAAELAGVAMLLVVLAATGCAFVVIRREIMSRFGAEAYAHEQHEWCITILTSIGDAVIVTDAEGKVVLLNTVARKLTGWGEDALGKPLTDMFRIVNETTRAPVANPVDKVLREGAIVGLANHTVLINREGLDVPIDDSGAPVKNKKGDLTGVVLVFRDITERRQAEQVLLRSQRQFHLIAETIPQMVWMARPDGYVEYFNRRWFDYAGVTPEQALGWEWQRVIHPEDLPRVLAKWQHSLATGEPCEAEYRLRRADGTYLWHIGRAMALGDESQVIKWFGTYTEFDEQKRTLDVLHESEERLKFALSAARMVAWDWDLQNGQVVRSDNASEIIGLGSGSAQTFKEIIHSEDQERVEEATAKVLRGEALYDLEFRIMTPEGRLIWVLDKARLRRDAAGRPTHLTGICADISERKRSEQLLLEADRRKNEFLAMLAHELRNPLAPIRNAAEVLRLLGPDDNKLRWARDVIERQVQHMTRLVDDLLDISRISRGRIQLQKSQVNIVSVVAGAIETTRPFMESRTQNVQIVMPIEPGIIYGDEIRLVQVLANLLHNAMKFTPDGGRIMLTVSRLPKEVFITVRDTGIGIPDEMLGHVFDLFTQLDATLERSQGGLGIGLTLVKTLVEMHDGSVRARSEGRGKGSEFTVRLPLLPDAPGAAHAAPTDSVKPDPASASLRVLVVDDNRDAAESLCMLLKLLEHSTRSANDGDKALEVAREFSPQAVFIDIGLPGMNGYEVCARMRKLAEVKSAVCIALTGFGTKEDRERSRQAGFDHHLVKPVDPVAVQELLRQIQQHPQSH